jgi:DNA (cytosine-5)-methyltransferase 1
MTDKLKIVSLFSGYGTQELALKYIGVNYEVIANCDNFNQANECYDVLHQTSNGNLGDIKLIKENEFPNCDFLTYSFPCVDVSISGKQQGIKEGTRSGLLFDVERILSVNRPKYLLMENVKNLISKKHIESFENHILFLKQLGYSSFWKLLNGADFGCPQNRERIFMMSVLNGDLEDVKQKMMNVDKYKKTRVPMSIHITQNKTKHCL